MFPWNLCVHLCAFALMTPGVKSVEITSLKTSNVFMHFVRAFDSPIRLKTAAKVKNFPVCGKLGLNLGTKCQRSAYTTRAPALSALYGAKTTCKLTDEEIFSEMDGGNIVIAHDS